MTSEKYITIQFSNGDKFKIPAHIIATDRANYYAQKDVERGDSDDYVKSFTSEFEYTMNENSELKDWFYNNMDWVDVEAHAELMPRLEKFDYKKGFTDTYDSFRVVGD